MRRNDSRAGRAIAPLFVAALAGCSHPQVGPDFPTRARSLDPATFECCFEPEKFYPPGLTDLALQVANTVGPTASSIIYKDYEDSVYPGKLTGKADAHAALVSQLEPLDFVLISNHSYRAGKLMPGRFSHVLVYVGTEAELRAAGLWSVPALAPYRAQIRAGNVFLEAAWPDVHLYPTEKALQTDQALAVRPAGYSHAQKRAALERLFAVMGRPFNYSLGIDPNGQRFACTGLIAWGMPELGFTHRTVYGQDVVMPDDVAAQAVRGERLSVVTYLTGTDDGHAFRSPFALMVELASFWGVPGAG